MNDEIERLRKENNDLREIVSLHGEVVKLAQMRHEERDEARREVCELKSTTRWNPYFPLTTKHEYAIERGWDCFKENNNDQ